MHRKTIILIAIVVVALATAATLYIFPYEPKSPPTADDTGSSATGIQGVVNANNRFAFELYSELDKKEDGNMFFSPYSMSAALAMTYEGARGDTADEMKSVFHFPDDMRPDFAAIYNEINSGSEEYELRTGNALWVQQDYPFNSEYMTTVEKYYGGKAANVDFVGKTEQTRQTINAFIEDQTNDRIKDLIPSGVLSSMTRMVLTNAIYFKGTWVWEFDKGDTRDAEFRISPSDKIMIPMMQMDPEKASFNYADLDDLQILELPYKGDQISMLILLPTKDLDSLGKISASKLAEYKSRMKDTRLDSITMPRFEFDTKYFMNDALSGLGMPAAFGPDKADFSGMTTADKLYISSVIHQAFIKVDEEGTEAAAATAVVMDKNLAMPRNVFIADHPFIFIIQDKKTGNILFMGRVTDPSR
jgi:serine protease inhibitor